jgi:hypothetical protein
MPALGPSLQGFENWVSTSMGVPASVMPDPSYLQASYDYAIDIVLSSNISGGGLDLVPSYSSDTAPLPPPASPPYYQTPTIYTIAVYNLAGDMLVRIAPDNPAATPPPDNAPTYWSDLRTSLGVNSLTFGFVQSTADQGTSTSLLIPDSIKNMSLMNLQQLSTPWGRTFLALAGQWGGVWGLS